jgi:hypothetical protein
MTQIRPIKHVKLKLQPKKPFWFSQKNQPIFWPIKIALTQFRKPTNNQLTDYIYTNLLNLTVLIQNFKSDAYIYKMMNKPI